MEGWHRISRAIALSCLLALPLSASATEPAARTSAMWVYKTEALMADPAARTELFAFCHARAITDLFWATHYAGTGTALVIDPAPELHAFLREASAHGLRLHALSGDPSHVLPAHHERVLARVDATIDFNNAAPANERFAGVHFDIEPHGLPAWKNAATAEKCELLTQLVEVNAKAVARLKSRASDMLYGADITFWFDKANADGSPVYPVTFRGVTKDATKHLLDLADNVGIMSYRDKATGPNGIVSLVEKTIRYADTVKGKAYVGIKMAPIGPAMEGFYGQTEQAMLKALEPIQAAFANDRGYAGLAFFMYGAYREMKAE